MRIKSIRSIYALAIIVLCSTASLAQTTAANAKTSAKNKEQLLKRKTRNGIGFLPSKKLKKINGLSIGLFISPKDPITINGLNIEIIGLGSVSPIPLTKIPITSVMLVNEKYKGKYKQKVNGITLSVFGHFNTGVTNGFMGGLFLNRTNTVNGICFAGGVNRTFFFYGIEASTFSNKSTYGRGLQIALFNTCYNFRGIQIGLWNKNGKRSLPFINWQFSK